MSEFELVDNVYGAVTPAGAYFAVGAADAEPARNLLMGILRSSASPLLSTTAIREWTGFDSDQDALSLLHRLQELRWIGVCASEQSTPALRIETDAPALLAHLSDEKRALLADSDGLQLASIGFTHEAAEQIAALAAELCQLHTRYKGLLRGNLRLRAGGLGAIDAAGNSQLSFWPMHIGTEVFLLVVAGAPLLQSPAYAELIRGLVARYAERA